VSQKIDVPIAILEKLYVKEKRSSYEIAKAFACNPSAIQQKLKECNIELRHPKTKINISRILLEGLYSKEGLSTYKIAEKLGVGRTTVQNKLVEFNICRRQLKRVPISKEKLKHLYYDEKLCISEIADLHGLSTSTVLQKFKNNNIGLRSRSERQEVYSKYNFSGNLEEKDYLIGFRLGDLNCKRASLKIIKIKSNTTKQAQLKLMRSLFEKYGHSWVKEYSGKFNFECALNNTFDFLVPKQDKIEDWITQNDDYFMAFFGGYVDAEGTIKIYNKKARFRVGSYDKNLLKQAFEKLQTFGIRGSYRIDSYKNEHQNNNFWRSAYLI